MRRAIEDYEREQREAPEAESRSNVLTETHDALSASRSFARYVSARSGPRRYRRERVRDEVAAGDGAITDAGDRLVWLIGGRRPRQPSRSTAWARNPARTAADTPTRHDHRARRGRPPSCTTAPRRAAHLPTDRTPVPAGPSGGRDPGQPATCGRQIHRADVRPASVPAPAPDGIRAHLELAGDPAGDLLAEDGVARVGQRWWVQSREPLAYDAGSTIVYSPRNGTIREVVDAVGQPGHAVGLSPAQMGGGRRRRASRR